MSDAGTPQDRVYTIPPGVSFVDGLAAGLMARAAERPDGLAGMTVLLPNRRACRNLGEAFLRRADGRPLLLPRLVPLGEVDEAELLLSATPVTGADLDLPPAIDDTRRQLLLARLIAAADGSRASLETHLALAAELARLLDQVHTEGLSLDALPDLVGNDHAAHWQITLDFLSILTRAWPGILQDEQRLDPARRRALLQAAQAEALGGAPPTGPIVAAGSTGTVPATAHLLSVIAQLPEGCVVLPGLDRHLDSAAWAHLDPAHPQYNLSRLLKALDLEAEAVADWPCADVPATSPNRARLLSLALWPSAAPGRSPDAEDLDTDALEEALNGVRQIDCPTPLDEAATIALIMRQTLESPGRTAALVTPDRRLARRVAAELRRWQVEVDDSAGVPLIQTPVGAFLCHGARLVAGGFEPLALLSMGKHPLAACGMARGQFLADLRGLEMAVLRGPRPGPGLDSLAAKLDTEKQAPQRALLDRLGQAAAPFVQVMAAASAPLDQLVDRHIRFMEALACNDQTSGDQRLWRGEAGEVAAEFILRLLSASADLPDIDPAEYAAAFEALLKEVVVRPRHGRHPRLAVLGLLEARLHHADLMILGGLNEGTWPPESVASPWMSRPMMVKFGLPAPERRIGLTAHDFAQAFGARELVLTRAVRAEGTPTVPCRWLRRLAGMAKRLGQADTAQQATEQQDWLNWRRGLDRPSVIRAAARPQPRPPLSARPRKLYVTAIDRWMRDPYAIYARQILNLRELDPLDASPSLAEYGNFIHDTLEQFVRQYSHPLPADARDRMLALGREVLGDPQTVPGIWAFWWPRFERIVDWFLEQERERGAGIAASHCEVKGELVLAGPAGPFTVAAIADRIDRLTDGRLWIIDYKTGTVPSAKEVEKGFAPQLPLEAAIAAVGGFPGIDAAPVAGLEYWRLQGLRPAGERRLASKSMDPESLGQDALDHLRAMIRRFDDPDTPYEARPWPELTLRFNPYDHLERAREWSSGEETE